ARVHAPQRALFCAPSPTFGRRATPQRGRTPKRKNAKGFIWILIGEVVGEPKKVCSPSIVALRSKPKFLTLFFGVFAFWRSSPHGARWRMERDGGRSGGDGRAMEREDRAMEVEWSRGASTRGCG